MGDTFFRKMIKDCFGSNFAKLYTHLTLPFLINLRTLIIERCILEEESEDLIWVPTTKKKKKLNAWPFLWKILADSGTTIGGGNLGVATQRAQPDFY